MKNHLMASNIIVHRLCRTSFYTWRTFGTNAVEWIRETEIGKVQFILGSRRSTQSDTLTFPGLKRDSLRQLWVLGKVMWWRGINFCKRDSLWQLWILSKVVRWREITFCIHWTISRGLARDGQAAWQADRQTGRQKERGEERETGGGWRTVGAIYDYIKPAETQICSGQVHRCTCQMPKPMSTIRPCFVR